MSIALFTGMSAQNRRTAMGLVPGKSFQEA
jgi:hypothetical protein